jgi:MFS family permease
MNKSFHFLTKIYNNRWFQVVLGFIAFISLGTVYSYSILRVEIQREFQIGSTLSGLPYLTSLFFYALTMFLSGRYLSNYKPSRIMVIGSLLVSIGWILSSFTSSIYVLIITYGVVMGVGVGLVYGIPIIVIPKWFQKHKGLAVGLVLAGFGLSPLLTSPITQLALDNVGLSRTFLIFGIVFMFLLPLISILFHNPPEIEVSKLLSNDKNILGGSNIIKTKNFWLLYSNFILGTTTGLMVIGASSVIGVNYYQLEIHVVAYTIAFFAVMNAIGRPIFGSLNDILGTKKTIVLIHLITIISALVVILKPFNPFISFVVGFSPLWMMLGGWLALAPAATHALFDESNYSKNYGLVFTGYGFGAIIGVVFSGRIIDSNLSLEFLFIPIIIISILLIIITSLLLKKKDN